MNKFPIIAISGWKRSGKDTVADYLVNNHNFYRIGFADPLKNSVAIEYDLTTDHLTKQKLKEKALLQYPVEPKDSFSQGLIDLLKGELAEVDGKLYWTPRALCILKGSANRAVDAQYWVSKAVRQIEDELSDPGCNDQGAWHQGVVIPDLRYRSEATQLKEAFGNNLTLVRIERFDFSPSIDPSERDLDKYNFDFTIKNTTTVDNLYKQVERLLIK